MYRISSIYHFSQSKHIRSEVHFSASGTKFLSSLMKPLGYFKMTWLISQSFPFWFSCFDIIRILEAELWLIVNEVHTVWHYRAHRAPTESRTPPTSQHVLPPLHHVLDHVRKRHLCLALQDTTSHLPHSLWQASRKCHTVPFVTECSWLISHHRGSCPLIGLSIP